MQCEVKQFFNLLDQKHIDELTVIINNVHDKIKKLYDSYSTEEFYKELLNELKGKNTPFKVEYSSDITKAQTKRYKDSLIDLQNEIIHLIPRDSLNSSKNNKKKNGIDISILNNKLNNDFRKDLGAGHLRFKNSEEDNTFIIETQGALENLSNLPKEVRFKKYVQDTYGNCFGALKQMKNLFSREIFTNTFCNFETGELITNTESLNKNIAFYKNELFRKIVDFLQEINPDNSYTSEIYSSTNNVTSGYYTVLNDMVKYMNSVEIENIINDEYSKVLFSNESKTLDAIYAYTMLKYFDALIDETMGKTIKIKKHYRNSETPLNVMKYEFAKDSEHQRKSWSDSENRTAVQNSSKFIKFALNSIPLKVNGIDSKKNIGASQLNYTWCKLFADVHVLADKEIRGASELIDYIYAFHNSPIYYAGKIFKLLNESKDIQDALKVHLKFTDTDLGVIQSMYRYVFSYDPGMYKKLNFSQYEPDKRSIRSIEFNKLRTSYNLGKYSLLSDIASFLDDVMDASYFYTSYGLDGGLKTGIREKYKDRRISEKFKNSINSINNSRNQDYRLELKNQCSIDFDVENNISRGTVTIPLKINDKEENLSFKFSTTSLIGILDQAKVDITSDNDFYKKALLLFDSNSPIDLSNTHVKNKLLTKDNDPLSQNLNEDEQLFKQIVKFIDDRLGTQFLHSYDGLNKLNIYINLQINEKINPLVDLLLYATKSQIISNLYYDFNEALLDENNTDYVSNKDFLSFLKNKYTSFNNLTEDKKKTLFLVNNNIYKLKTLPSNTQWVDVYAQATLIMLSENNANTSKNQENNNDANYVTSFLGGQMFNICYKAKKEQKRREKLIKLGELIPQSAASALLFTNNTRAIKQCVINSDIKTRNGSVKSIRNLNQSELLYNSIIHNFWNSFYSTGEYCIQPTTYSDKVKLIQYLIDGKSYKKFNVSGKNKSLSELNKNELIELYRTSIGESSRLAKENVIYFYEQLWGQHMTLDQINYKLKSYTEDKLVKEASAKGLQVMLDFHYRIKKDSAGNQFLSINELIDHQAQYNDINILTNKFKE